MSLCSLGIGNMTMVCKYGTDHRLQKCHLCELELKVKGLDDRLNSLFNNIKVIDHFDDIPYKCPVCLGTGKFYNLADLPPTSSCRPCSGKGIVWSSQKD
jgi:hypothetical protein